MRKKYAKQQAYSRESDRFSLISSSFSFILIVGFILFQGFGKLNGFLAEYTENQILLGLLFFGVLYFVMDILSIPFSLYDTFVIEEKYGFNKTTARIFIGDKLKGYLLAIILGGGILALIYKFYLMFPDSFWIYCWIVLSAFMVFMAMFYSNLIVPLFNKQKPLPEGELKAAIEEMSKKAGFKLQNIYEIDGSKRSTRANAYFTGLGAKKRIVLYDTLIKELSTEEIVAVLAHEIGHYKKKHTVTGMLMGIAQSGIMLYLLSLVVSNPLLSNALGVETPQFHIGLVAFALLYTPLSTVIGILMSYISRKNEYEADNFAAEVYSANHLVSALKKLSSSNLSNLTPHPAYVFVHYSHPTLLQRVLNLKKG